MELAKYEKLDHLVDTNASDIKNSMFCEKPFAFSLILEENGKPFGLAIYFNNPYRHRVFLSELFIREDYRGKGYGTKVFKYIC